LPSFSWVVKAFMWQKSTHFPQVCRFASLFLGPKEILFRGIPSYWSCDMVLIKF
jgi:hypothetical protein